MYDGRCGSSHRRHYRKCSGERTGVQSIFKSFQTCFFFEQGCDSVSLCERPDPCTEIKFNDVVLPVHAHQCAIASICAMLTTKKKTYIGVRYAHPCAIAPTCAVRRNSVSDDGPALLSAQEKNVLTLFNRTRTKHPLLHKDTPSPHTTRCFQVWFWQMQRRTNDGGSPGV